MITPAGPSSLRDSSEGGPGTTRRRQRLVLSDHEEDLYVEDASKQERKIDMDVGDVSTAGADINAASVLVSTAGVGVSTASPTISTASPIINTASPTRTADVFAAKTLVYIRRSATKDKDEDLAQRMLEEERESLSIAERARLLSELIDKRKKLQAAQRYEAGTLFMPMDSVMGKERTKRAGLNLQEESSKRQKTSEVSGLAAEQQELFTLKAQGSTRRLLELEITLRVDICMLMEKEYPLSRGTFTLMLVAKLFVDEDSEIARELLRMIVMQDLKKENVLGTGSEFEGLYVFNTECLYLNEKKAWKFLVSFIG
ncbi:hypothetical protein Tco_0232931 [Tanacetum coccineum]